MKKLFLFLFLFSTTPVFGITNPQGETLTATVQQVLSNSAVIRVTATNIIRAANPPVSVRPDLFLFKVSAPTQQIPVTAVFANLNCSGTLCSGTPSLTAIGLTCDTEYKGRVSVRSANPSNPSVLLEELTPIFKTQPCAQLATTIKQTNSTKTSISATLEVDTRGTISGSTRFSFSLTATKEGETPIQSTEAQTQVTIAPTGPTRITTGNVVINGLECETEYSIVGTSKTNGRNNTPSASQVVTTSACDSSLGTGGTTQTTGNNEYIFLTPLPLGEGLTPQDSVIIGAAGETSQNGILGILQRIFTIMLVVAIILAVVFMIIGGARYATGDSLGSKMGGKEIITNAITGLLFALLSWLLLNIVNPDLLRFTLSIPNIGNKLTYGTSTPVGGPTNTIPGEGCSGFSTADNEACFARIIADEPRVRGELRNAGITIERGDTPCARFGQEACTTVGLLSATTLDRLKQLKTSCPQCSVIITGATEFWLHGTAPEFRGNHRQFIAVDLKLGNSSFDSFIRSKTMVANPFPLCVETFSYLGLRFCNESRNHWHVDTVTTTGGGTTSGSLIKFENIGVGNNGVWGKASGQPITGAQVTALVSSARVRSWYPEVQRVAGTNSKVLAAIIMVESSGDPTKVRTEPDGRKSCGLGQLLTDTAKRLDATLRNKSVEEICTALKEPNYNIRLSNQHYNSLSGNFKAKVAAYNGGSCVQVAGEPDCRGGATGTSANCSGLMRFECPWDSNGCYDPTKPNDAPTNTSCVVNTGYEVTRFYVDKVKKISDQLSR